MTFQIIPATTEHIRLAARALRPMDRAEIERRGYHVRHLLHLLYRQSPLRRAALLDGQVAAVWGCEGSVLDTEGVPWLFTTPVVERSKVEFFRETRRQIDEMLKSRQRLSTYVLASYTQSTRFFAALGFRIGPPEPIGVGGENYCLMSLERS
jgi:hypothetical protein